MINIESYENISSENNVTILNGDRNYYFLHQKNTGQNQFDYYVGNRKIEHNIVKNYTSNIKNNIYLSEKYGFGYLHLICESKEVAHSDVILKYSNLKLNSLVLKKHLLDKVIYPRLNHEDYYIGDSHNNNRGALKQCIAVLNMLGLSVPSFEPKFVQYTNEKGDLASKIGISTVEEKLSCLENLPEPEFTSFKLSDFMEGNSGNISYCFNPNAVFQKRLLCFADSFVGGHIDVYARFFEEVVLVRSPFIIESMLLYLEPDFVLTSNTERYLVNVPLFSQTPWFFNYLQVGKIKNTFSNSDLTFLKMLFSGKDNDDIKHWRDKRRINIPKDLDHSEISIEHVKNQKDIEYIIKSATLYENTNIDLSIQLMKIAHEFRPQGQWIKSRIEEYKKKSGN